MSLVSNCTQELHVDAKESSRSQRMNEKKMVKLFFSCIALSEAVKTKGLFNLT